MKLKKSNGKKDRIAKLIKWSPFVVKPVLFASVLLAGFGVWRIVAGITGAIIANPIAFLQGSGTILGITGLIAGVTMLIHHIENNYKKDHSFAPKVVNKVDDFLSGICSVFKFLKELASMTYIKECPMIEWGGETGKIEKIVDKAE